MKIVRSFFASLGIVTCVTVSGREERVLVGRAELVSPSFVIELERGFRAAGGVHWREHRYYPAYRALAGQRGVVSPALPPTLSAP